jgi:cyclophilin family peptidyl-prolyl cis-trans isomerase
MSKIAWAVFAIVLVAAIGGGIFLLTKPAPPPVQSDDTVISVPPEITPEPTLAPATNQTSAPAMEIDHKKTYTVTLHTSAGDMVLEMDTTNTPITANNFIHLAKSGFYDKTIFHRIIKGFMIQGGDPKGNGTGGPGYQFADEYLKGQYTRGTVAMANSGPNTNGSQFFIMHADYQLPNLYVIFGHVTSGLDVLDKIATSPVTTSASGESSQPVTPVTITTVSVSEK